MKGLGALGHTTESRPLGAQDTSPAAPSSALERLRAKRKLRRRGRQTRPDAPTGGRLGRKGQRIDLRVLLLSADGEEPAFHAWEAALDREGVPYHAVVARRGHPPVDARALSAGATRARYQAIIVAAGGLPSFDGTRYISALTPDEWAALADFERDFGIRRITGFAYPSALYGLSAPTSSGTSDGLAGHVTAAGAAVFGELRGEVPVDPRAYAHLATAADPSFTTLVAGPHDSALVGVHTHPDGREEMVCTVDGNAAMIHVALLRHGMLRWVTRGSYLGHERHYLALQVDDVFLGDHSWDPDSACTVPIEIRLGRDDVEAAVGWSRERGVRLDMVFNGGGAQPPDDATDALLEHASQFGWVNHTFSHVDLDDCDPVTLQAEIRRNIEFAHSAGLTIDEIELATGGHSGLANMHLPDALAANGVRWIAADNSREPVQRTIGAARTVPRHPTNLAFNACTREAQLDEYHHLYLTRAGRERGRRGTTRSRLAPAVTWRRFVDLEAETILAHVLDNDPRPHYVHQSNLAGERIFYDLADTVLERHHELFCVELTQPTLGESGAELARRAAWRAALRARSITGFVKDGRMHLRSTEPVRFPVTGAGGADAGATAQESRWTACIGPEDDDVVLPLA
jgi:hypothetical protein